MTTWHVAIRGEAEAGNHTYSNFRFKVHSGTDKAEAKKIKTNLEALGLNVDLTYSELEPLDEEDDWFDEDDYEDEDEDNFGGGYWDDED